MLRARVDKLMEGRRDVVEDAIAGRYFQARWIKRRNGKQLQEVCYHEEVHKEGNKEIKLMDKFPEDDKLFKKFSRILLNKN